MEQLLPLHFFGQALRRAQARENNRVYHCGVVIWLMIVRRLQPQGTLGGAVAELLAELPVAVLVSES